MEARCFHVGWVVRSGSVYTHIILSCTRFAWPSRMKLKAEVFERRNSFQKRSNGVFSSVVCVCFGWGLAVR